MGSLKKNQIFMQEIKDILSEFDVEILKRN